MPIIQQFAHPVPNLHFRIHTCINAHHLLEDLGDEASGDGASTLAHVEALSRLEGDGSVDLALHLDVVAGHDHLAVVVLGSVGPGQVGGLVGSADVELGTVVLAEAGVAATLVLGEHVHGHEELLVRLLRPDGGNDHASADVLTLDTAEEEARVVTGSRLGARLLEGLNVRNLGLDGVALADDLNLRVTLESTALNTARRDGTTARDGEDILNGHQEGLLELTLRRRDPLINGVHELVDLLHTDLRLATLHGAEGGAHDDRGLIALEAVGAEELAHLHLDELQHLGVLKSIDLVDENDNLLDTDLTSQQQMLSGLRHLSIGRGNDNDRAVHVGGTSNHVLDVIGVTGTVDVGVVLQIGGVFDVGGGDGDTTLALLGSLIDGAILEVGRKALLGLPLRDGGSEGGLDMLEIERPQP